MKNIKICFHEGHDHSSAAPDSKDRQIAMLTYMLNHNKHHAEELHELGHKLSNDAEKLIHEAVDNFNEGNAKLEAALKLLQEE